MPRLIIKNFISGDGTSDIQISFLKELENIFKGRVEFEHLNAKENESQVLKYKVRELPTIIIECNGKEKERFVGLTQQLFLRRAIENALSECK